MTQSEKLRQLLGEEIRGCRRCPLSEEATPVPYSGPTSAALAIQGEAPGSTEDVKGQPFVGQSGKLLRKSLEKAEIDIDAVAIVNTVSCFPKGTPRQSHVDACSRNLQAQLRLIRPSSILLLGNVALGAWKPQLRITKARGRPFEVEGVVMFPTFHPAYMLRNGSGVGKWIEDLRLWKKVAEAGSRWFSLCGKDFPETCASCGAEEELFDDTGLPWCCPCYINTFGDSSLTDHIQASKRVERRNERNAQ